MNVKWIIPDSVAFGIYKEKLSYVDNSSAHHKGIPNHYPCIAVSQLVRESEKESCWEHYFIYASSLEDLKRILENQNSMKLSENDPIPSTPGTHEEQLIEASDEKKQWESFWEMVESPFPRDQEFKEYDDLQKIMFTLSYPEAIKRCKVFMLRWPKGTYGELIRYRLNQFEKVLNYRESSVSKAPDPEPPKNAGHVAKFSNS